MLTFLVAGTRFNVAAGALVPFCLELIRKNESDVVPGVTQPMNVTVAAFADVPFFPRSDDVLLSVDFAWAPSNAALITTAVHTDTRVRCIMKVSFYVGLRQSGRR